MADCSVFGQHLAPGGRCSELTCPQHGLENMTRFHADDENACGVRYGSNPDGCHQPAGHGGKSHTNRWGTTWPKEQNR